MHFLAEEGPLSGTVLHFEGKKEWLIGRDPTKVDFSLADQTVSRKQARCSITDEGFVIEDLSHTNPTLVNDAPISAPTLLQEGDHVRMGQSLFLFSEKEPEEEVKKQKKEEPKVEEKSPYDTIFEEEEGSVVPGAEGGRPSLYDTIFESKEEELPVHILGDTRFQLKVISGPNAGAEFGLEPDQTYILGKDPNTCDIVFHDLSVSRQHARIQVFEDGRMLLEDLGSTNKTMVNGQPIEGQYLLSSQDLVSFGTTVFSVIDKEAQVQTVYSSSPVIEAAFHPEKAKKESWKKQVIPLKYLLISGSFLLVMIVMIFSFFSLFKSEPVEITKKDYTKDIQKDLKGYEDVEFVYNPAGETVFLVGHVLTPIDQEELLYKLRQHPYIEKIENKIVIDEYVWKNVNEVLQSNENWRSVNLHSPKAGQFVLSGYVKTQKDAEDLSDYLNVNFSYLDRLENKVVIENVLTLQIGTMILAQGFSGLTFQLTNGDCILAGAYDNKMSDEFQTLLKDLKQIAGVRSVKNLAIATSAQQGRIDLSDRYTITGFVEKDGKNVSVVANGQIISVGEELDGMMISEIEKNTILLEKEGLKYKINYSR